MRNLAFFIIITTTIVACEGPKKREETEPVVRQAGVEAGAQAGDDLGAPDMDAAPCECVDMGEAPCECLDFEMAGVEANVEAGVEAGAEG